MTHNVIFILNYILEQKITPENLLRINNEDMRILCPVIGERLILESYIEELNGKTGANNQINKPDVIQVRLKKIYM